MSLIPDTSYNRRVKPLRSAVTQVHAAYSFPSPMKGIDVQQQLAGGDPMTAVVLENLLPSIQGVELRQGYTLWQDGLPSPAATIMSYIAAEAATPDAAFAACVNGEIYDITTPNQVAPLVPVLAVPNQTDPGNFSFINFNNEFGSYLLMVSAGGGYFHWDGTAWTEVAMGVAAGEIDGIDPKEFQYIWEWGNRVWFVQRNSLVAWYLPVGQITGAATALPLGGIAPHGGALAYGANWTVDGGGGTSGSTTSMSDKIVFITDQGDVMIYGGTDPDEAATFKIEGRWYVGRLPVGGRAVKRYGSDVMFISERGLVFLSELLRGKGFFESAARALRINPELAVQVGRSLEGRYWEVTFLPHEQAIIVNYPPAPGEPDTQWLYLVNSTAFAKVRNMPMFTVGVVAGRTLFSDYVGNVWWGFEGESDGGTPQGRGLDIEGYMVTTFQAMGDAVRQKRALLCKMQMVAPAPPAVTMQLNCSFSPSGPGGPVFILDPESVWNTAEWDASHWVGGQQGYTAWRGAEGVGYFVALATRVKGLPGTTIVAWAAVVDAGGILGQ